MSEWISVEDKLPELLLDVLLVHTAELIGASSIFMGYRSVDYWFETHYYCPKNIAHQIPEDQITHWMPLPKGPTND